ncbi:SepM family pheromone-processing serine protease [Streptococcus oricebi]|uniref:endopeptidase La n=1 Tax=Streptococcus oricebi TaxID=1547447 RepID=A0ABS5B1Y0_9STRE|nr:SepM family pheromone-processing serine protease [Streptococcus oricebi]MBP2622828.1 peptidase S16 [Streptococcus oricebi]
MKTIKTYKWPILIFLTIGLAYTAVMVRLPYYVEVPGMAEDIRQVLRVDDKEDKADGSYQFVTVGVEQATFAHLVYAWLTPFTDIYSAEEMTGGSTHQEFNRINQFYMETSQNVAKYQGLTTAGKEISMDYLGVYVLSVTKDSTFKGVLNIADTVTGVDDKTFKSSAELIDYVASHKIGDKVKVNYEEDGQKKSATGKIIKLENGKNGIGIGLVDRTEVKSSIPIEFSTQGIGGPSAGLMFSLAIYTQIADPNLRAGRDIAGTGTIAQDGKVGDIGGIDKKVVSAAQSGAEIFFVPNNPVTKEQKKADPKARSNYDVAVETAKKIKTKMKIVPVKTLQEAIDYLKKNQATS